MEALAVKTHAPCELIDITAQIGEVVRRSGIKSGICAIFIPHTTAGVTINENADPAVVKDLLKELDKIVPLRDNYLHTEGNSAAHIKSSLIGCSCTVIIEQGCLQLGTWQSIFFCEFDGPRSRTVWVKVVGGR